MWVLRKEIIAKHGIVLYVIGRTQTLRGVALWTAARAARLLAFNLNQLNLGESADATAAIF